MTLTTLKTLKTLKTLRTLRTFSAPLLFAIKKIFVMTQKEKGRFLKRIVLLSSGSGTRTTRPSGYEPDELPTAPSRDVSSNLSVAVFRVCWCKDTAKILQIQTFSRKIFRGRCGRAASLMTLTSLKSLKSLRSLRTFLISLRSPSSISSALSTAPDRCSGATAARPCGFWAK